MSIKGVSGRAGSTILKVMALAAALAHCGDGGDTTGRVRVTFPVSVRGINSESDNSLGWHVSVEQAFVARAHAAAMLRQLFFVNRADHCRVDPDPWLVRCRHRELTWPVRGARCGACA